MKATIKLFPWELASMPEYSSTLPTGTTLWKMWKRDGNDYERRMLYQRSVKLIGETHPGEHLPKKWYVGQYIPCDIPGQIGIRWMEVLLIEGPKPLGYSAPDWSNYDRWKKERQFERKSADARPSHG